MENQDKRYKMIAEVMQDFIFIVDKEWRVTYVNNYSAKELGLKVEDIVGKTVDHFFSPEISARQKERLHRVFTLKEPLYTEVLTPFPNRTLWLDTWLIPLKNEKDEVVEILGISRDTTERKRMEMNIETEHQQFVSIFDSIDEVVYVSDPDTYEVIYANKVARNIFGNMAGKKCYEALQDHKEPCSFCTNKYIFGDGAAGPYLWEFQNKRNKRWYHCIDRAIRWPDGRMVRYEMAIDVTDRKEAEEALRRSEEQYRGIVDSQQDVIVRIKPDGTFTFVNDAYCKAFGKTRDELLGSKFMPLVHEEDLPGTLKAMEGLKVPPYRATMEQRAMTAQGWRWFEWEDDAVRNDKGETIEIQGVGRDITKRKIAEAALKSLAVDFADLEGQDFFEAVSRHIAVSVGVDYVFIGEYIKERYSARIVGGYAKDKKMDIFEYDLNHTPCENVIGKTLCFYPKGVAKKFPKDTLLAEMGIECYMGYPISGRDGEPAGLIVAMSGSPLPEPELTANMFKIFAERVASQIRRMRSDEELRANERFLTSVFSSIQDGISVLDRDLTILRVNSTMERWYAHSMPLVGKKCYQAYHGRGSHCDTCPSRRTLETKEAAYEVSPKIGPGGKQVGWFDLYSFPLLDAATGELTGVIEYVRDITKGRRTEEELEKANADLMKSYKKLKQLALLDPHTGCFNHRYLEDVIEAEFYRAERHGSPLSVIMLDIDYFKSINEVYGHPFGDLVLKQLARLLKTVVRRYDILVRFGGEEFVIISPGTDRSTAVVLAQRILDAINLYNFQDKTHSVKLKLSVAVTSYPEDNAIKGIDLIENVERILNRVKEVGGDKVYSSLDMPKDKKQLAVKKVSDTEEIRFLRDKMEKLARKANQSLMEAIFAFAKTIELKDHYTGEHVERTVQFAVELAKEIGLAKDEVERIRKAAILHDLGKIGISEKILLKRAKLSAKEFDEIKRHPQIGADIIRPIQFLHAVLPLILYHHERWDGTGYPSGLKGEEIPVGARVIAIADVYQALISHRPYRKAYPRKEVEQILKHDAGTHFDPKIVDAFMKVLHRDKK